MAKADAALLALLPKIPIFGGLDGEPLNRVIELLGEEDHAPGGMICKQGENGRSMFIVRSGEVVIWRENQGRRRKMVRLGAGEAFGEMCLVEIQPRSATVTTEVQTKLLTLHHRTLCQLYGKDLPTYTLILGNIARELSRRLRKADQRLCELAEKTPGDDDGEKTLIRAPVKRRTTLPG